MKSSPQKTIRGHAPQARALWSKQTAVLSLVILLGVGTHAADEYHEWNIEGLAEHNISFQFPKVPEMDTMNMRGAIKLKKNALQTTWNLIWKRLIDKAKPIEIANEMLRNDWVDELDFTADTANTDFLGRVRGVTKTYEQDPVLQEVAQEGRFPGFGFREYFHTTDFNDRGLVPPGTFTKKADRTKQANSPPYTVEFAERMRMKPSEANDFLKTALVTTNGALLKRKLPPSYKASYFLSRLYLEDRARDWHDHSKLEGVYGTRIIVFPLPDDGKEDDKLTYLAVAIIENVEDGNIVIRYDVVSPTVTLGKGYLIGNNNLHSVRQLGLLETRSCLILKTYTETRDQPLTQLLNTICASQTGGKYPKSFGEIMQEYLEGAESDDAAELEPVPDFVDKAILEKGTAAQQLADEEAEEARIV